MTTNRSEPGIGGAYTLLGVAPGATPEEIKRAYRRLAFDLHPDRHPQASPAERQALAGRFAAVASAYDQIKDGKAPPPPYAPGAPYAKPPPGTNDRYSPYAVCGACGHLGWCHARGPCIACIILGTRCQGPWSAPEPQPKPKTCHTDGHCLRCRASVTRSNDLCDCPCHPRRQHRPPQPAPSVKKIPWYHLSLSRGRERLGNTKQFRQALRGLRQHCGRGRRVISAVELIYGPGSRTGTWYDVSPETAAALNEKRVDWRGFPPDPEPKGWRAPAHMRQRKQSR